jgi:hypothetical protein
MPTPWFLQQLGLDNDADARAIKRTYAARLRQIDQATDIDGFNALHRAYKAAQAWAERRAAQDVTEETPSVETSTGKSVGAEGQTFTATNDEHAHVVANPREPDSRVQDASQEQPAWRDPAEAARSALEALRADLADQQNAIVALGRQYRLLGDEHLSAPLLFEILVIDHLLRGGIAQRLALFHAAQKQFAWSDVMHLADLKARGAWVMQVQKESLAVDALRQSLAPALELIEMREAGHVDRIHGRALKCWPDLRSAIQAYPRYFSLCLSQADAAEWEQTYLQVARVAAPLPTPESGVPPTYSPAAHRARRGTTPGGTAKPVVGISTGFVVFMFIRLITSFGRHDNNDANYTPPPPPPQAVQAVQPTASPAPTYARAESTHHDYVMPPPYVPRRHAGDPPPKPVRDTTRYPADDPAPQVARTQHMGGPGRCDWLYERVHTPRWDVSGDDEERQRIADAVQTCRLSGHWSTTPATDPVFARLGITS